MEDEVRGDPPRSDYWKCHRCGYDKNFLGRQDCYECGTGRHRVARKIRRRKIGGKRGRNSGKVGTSK